MSGISLLILALWAYIRYSGELRDIGTMLDDTASFCWNKFLSPIYKGCLSRGIAQIASNTEFLTGGVGSSTHNRNVNGKAKKS